MVMLERKDLVRVSMILTDCGFNNASVRTFELIQQPLGSQETFEQRFRKILTDPAVVWSLSDCDIYPFVLDAVIYAWSCCWSRFSADPSSYWLLPDKLVSFYAENGGERIPNYPLATVFGLFSSYRRIDDDGVYLFATPQQHPYPLF